MKGLLYFTWFNWEYVAAGVYQYLIDEKELTELTIITCDGHNLPCHSNYHSRPAQCKLCKLNRNQFLKSLAQNKKKLLIKHHTIESLILNIDINKAINYEKLILNSQKSLRDFLMEYEVDGIKVGYGILSSYISNTRNYRPRNTPNSLRFFALQLYNISNVLESIKVHIEKNQYDQYLIFNGRTNDTRICFDLFNKTVKSDFRVIENFVISEDNCGNISELGIEVLPGVLPQDIVYRNKLIEDKWNDGDDIEKEEIGKRYFEERIYQLNFNKHKDLHSSNWDKNENPFLSVGKLKIAIFNSSQDEIAAIPETREFSFFGEQIDALKVFLKKIFILDQSEVILRIHPNLKDVKYSYHTDLKSLNREFNQLKIIQAMDNFNSYDLIKYADIIVVFGSTVGIEANFMGKPVINLGPAGYFFMDATYNPKSEDELDSLLKQLNELRPKSMDSSLKYAYFLSKPEAFSKYFTNVNTLFGRFVTYNYQKFKISFFIKKRMFTFFDKISSVDKINLIPIEEE